MKPTSIRRRAGATAMYEWPHDLHPLLARIFAARGLAPADIANVRLADLAAPLALGGIERACELLADAVASNQRICVVGDFDCDGATGTAVAVRGLRMLGARNVAYRVPNRFRDGYGLSSGLVDTLTGADAPQLIVTVDNGIASHAGVATARARGISVVVTDHHLPGETLPDADAIVNPNLIGDIFPSKALAGVGVMFYLLLALRARLYPSDHPDREDHTAAIHGRTSIKSARPDLSSLLDLVALGTVADLVPLDANNRILVEAGLRRIRAGRCCAGVAALYSAAGRDTRRAVASDLGFAIGPRINAAGRLDDMGIGIECLLSDDATRAMALAGQLSAINAQRQELQSAMVDQADAMVAGFLDRYRSEDSLPHGIVLYEPDWHPGVVGLVASKLKERLNRPVVALAPAHIEECEQGRSLSDSGAQEARTDRELRGSARSIAGFHLRDALAEVDAMCPGLMIRFGGHAMAAGLTMALSNLERFAAEFDAVARRRLDAEMLTQCVWSDGELAAGDFTFDAAQALRYAAPWGQGFAEPAFDNVFDVESWRAVGERHLKLKLRLDGHSESLDAIMFNALDVIPPPPRLRAVYQLDVDQWNGRDRLQLLVRHIEPV
ncbi:MAG: single-stranded-DNA-specific exonuclease RecJ [Dokdonella sp.]